MIHSRGPFARVPAPYEGAYSAQNIQQYEYADFEDQQVSASQWISAGALYGDAGQYSQGQCPPSYNVQQHYESSISYEEPVDESLYSWPYDSNAGYDQSLSSLPDPNLFLNAASLVSYSPRSDSSAVSASPQPNMHDYPHAFNFDYSQPAPATQFAPSSSSSSSWQPLNNHISRVHNSHSPSASCSSLDASDLRVSQSRETSPTQQETADPQAHRRRFPCVIIGCDRRFTSQYTLKVHMEAHKPKPRTSFPCTLGCSERFSRQHDRLRHEVAKHGKVCEFLCDDCGRFFSTSKTLGNHKCPVAQGGTRWVNS